MATTVRITFTGLCHFEAFQEGGDRGVRVLLPDATKTETHCGENLKAHEAWVITTAPHLNRQGGKKQLAIKGLDVAISAEPPSNLAVPTHLASLSQLSGGLSTSSGPRDDRVLAEFRLRGGSFGVMCRKAPNAVSDGWTQGPLRWQDTWAGTIDGDTLELVTDGDTHEFRAVNGMIDLIVVNLMPRDVAEWIKPDHVPLPPGSPVDAEDFRWFFWMFGWEGTNCTDQKVPTRASQSLAAFGLPYTCVGSGS